MTRVTLRQDWRDPQGKRRKAGEEITLPSSTPGQVADLDMLIRSGIVELVAPDQPTIPPSRPDPEDDSPEPPVHPDDEVDSKE